MLVAFQIRGEAVVVDGIAFRLLAGGHQRVELLAVEPIPILQQLTKPLRLTVLDLTVRLHDLHAERSHRDARIIGAKPFFALSEVRF